MKNPILSISLLFFIFSTFPVCANAESDIQVAAREVRFRVREYQVSLNSLFDLARRNSPSYDDKVSRDLVVCEIIGQVQGDILALGSSSVALEEALNGDVFNRAQLDKLDYQASTSSAQLPRYCDRDLASDYRKIPSLRANLDRAQLDLSLLLDFVEQFVPRFASMTQ